jgi:hypothetical protein
MAVARKIIRGRRVVPFLTAVFFSLALAGGPARGADLPYVAAARGDAKPTVSPRLIIASSPKVELVIVVASRADHQRTINRPRPDNPLGAFWSGSTSPFGYEAAPRHLRELRQYGLWGDLLLDFAVRLSDPPELAQILPWSDALLDAAARAPSEEEPAAVLETLRQEMKAFAATSRFLEHMTEKAPEYQRMETTLREHLLVQDPMEVNSSFWGVKPLGDIYVIPSPLVNGGYLTSVQVGDREDQFLAFGPALPDTVASENLLHHLAYHELSHPLIDPILKRRAGELTTSKAMWTAMVEANPGGGRIIQDWPDAVGEHLLRAYNIRLMKDRDPLLAELSVAMEQSSGFIFTRQFLEILDEYANGRERWGSLDEFFPTLAERLKQMSGDVSDLIATKRAPAFDIANPGFEKASGAWLLADWSLVRAGEIQGTEGAVLASVDRDSRVAHEGTASLRVEVGPETTGLIAVEQGPLAVRAGGTLRVSAHVKTDNVRREGLQQKVCGLYVLFLGKGGTVLSRAETDSAVGTLDWTELSGEFVAPPGTARAVVGILMGMSGTAWFDDLKIQRLD